MPLAEAGDLTLAQAAYFMGEEVYHDPTWQLMDFLNRALGGKQSLIPQRRRQPSSRSAAPATFAQPLIAAIADSPAGKAGLEELGWTKAKSPTAPAVAPPPTDGLVFKPMTGECDEPPE